VGYNWLECCEKASRRLEQRIVWIIESWQALGRQCEQVILVTHSMGGLVARACAKRVPGRIAGVIHGVMPALGAPAAYRRMTCGTEVRDFAGRFAAKILGATTYDTTPVLATSPGRWSCCRTICIRGRGCMSGWCSLRARRVDAKPLSTICIYQTRGAQIPTSSTGTQHPGIAWLILHWLIRRENSSR
jgi:pimeloyl-ACP methyl ester carboxylesterase